MGKAKCVVFKSVFMRITSLVLSLAFICLMCSCAPDNNDFDGTRFSKTRKISVMTDSSDPALEKYIHDSVLKDCNIDVVFLPSSYVIQDYGIVPDVAYYYDANRLNTYYKMNSVLNIAPFLSEYSSELSDLMEIIGEENITQCSDNNSEVWYLVPQNSEPDAMITFIRADWLEKLGLSAPSDIDEFHECLVAFRDNADVLLGKDASELIPFFVDGRPNVSCKPLFDSFLDTNISAEEFYVHGYCRTTQEGYGQGLKTLNDWYLEDLLPDDFQNIAPGSKESYEPIESGFVGAFCAKYDYLYKNGGNSHITELHNNCGSEANYIAVNTFKNADGEYTSWHEDYLASSTKNLFFPSTCTDPLACLVYLNWLSKAENIVAIRNFAESSTSRQNGDRYLLTAPVNNPDMDMVSDQYSDIARETALEVEVVRRGSKCVRYDPSIFIYVESEVDITVTYPTSTGIFTSDVIRSPEGCFDEKYQELYKKYLTNGAGYIYYIRLSEWNKVMVEGDMYPL